MRLHNGLLIAAVCASSWAASTEAQAPSSPLIKIVATGGTIANTISGRISISQLISDIRREFPTTHSLLGEVRLEIVDLLRVSSQDLSGRDFLNLARAVNREIRDPEVKGVVVTQGTYSAEESSFFLHLLVRSAKPVVIALSQRLHGSIGNDGDKNLMDAISVILSAEAAEKGVMVVDNQTISSARDVLKTSVRPGGFQSGVYGILGTLEADRVSFYRSPTRRHTYRSEFDASAIEELPKVEVISAYYDADPRLIGAMADLGVEGIVVSGFTNAGLPHRLQTPALEGLVKKGIPVVLTARGGQDNRIPVDPRNRFIEGDTLVPHKARILLQLALTKTRDPVEIQRIFDEY